MGVAQDYENLRKKKEQNDAQTTEFHVAQAYNSMFGKEEETSEKIDLASYFRERAKAKQIKSNNRENKKSSSSVKENGISLPRSEVLDRVTQARMQRKAEESAAYAKKKLEEQKAYDNMSLSEVDSRLEQLAQERAAFEKENGGALKNRFMKFATTIDPNAWDYAEKYEQNVKYLDENKAETEKLESMRLKKAQQEKLSALSQETLKLLDEYNEAENKQEELDTRNQISSLKGESENSLGYVYVSGQNQKAIAALKSQGYDDETIQELAYLRKTQQEEKEAQNLIDESRALAEQSTAAGFAVPRMMNIPAAVIGIYDNATQLSKNKENNINYGLNPNSLANAFTKANTAMDEANMEKRDWNVNIPILGKTDLYDMVYQAAASGTDSAVRAAVGGGATGAGVLMTGEVLNKGIIEGKENGYSDEKAIAYGLTQGLIEGVTEKYSLDMILKEPKSILGGIAKGFAAEGSEEVASNWLNRAADAIVNGNNSEIKQAYKTLTEQGVPGDKALSQIIVDMIGEDAESFLIGGLSGAGMSAGYHAPRATMQKISENQLQKQLGENIIASGEAQNLAKTVSETEDFQGNTRLQRSAERVLQTESNRQNAKQVGRVYQLAMEMASEADAKQQAENLDNAISQRLSELGENNAERVAPVLSKVIRGGTFTQTEAKTADTKAARQVLSEYFTPQQNDWVSKTQTKTRGQELADLLNRRQPITSEEAQRPVVAIAQTTEEGKNKQIGGTISEFAPRKLTVKAIHPTGIQFETENGQIVEDNQLIFNTDSAANFYRRATENGNVLFANLAIAAYDGSVGVDQYMTAAQRFYEAGRNGQNFSSVQKTNIVGQYLSESIAQQFYNLGENTANVEFAGIQKLYSDTDFNRAKRKGGVVKNYSQKLTGEAQAFVRFADALGKKYGIAVVVCDTIDGGNTNGFMKDNELYIALDAKGDLYTSVVGHELFHFIEQNSKPQAKKLRRLVLEQLRANEDFDYEAEIARYRDIYGEQYTTEELEEELVADSMFDVFDEAFVRKIVETDRTLAEKIRDFFTEFFEFLTGRSAEFTHLSRYFDAKPYEEIRDLFESALEDASENYKNEHKKTPDKAVRLSVNEKFAEEYDKWDKKSSGFAFKIGTTSEVLQKLGVDDRKIYWDASKILKIKRKHPSMSDRVIKQVPNILEEPIIVMNSKTKPGRITLFGEVYDDTDVPVLAVLELHPTDRGGNEIEIIKLASAFGKDKNLQNFIRTSDILYIDPNKKRIRNWLAVNRLQLPLPNFQYGFSNTIKPQKDNGVKNSISDLHKNDTKVPEKAEKTNSETNKKEVRFSLNKPVEEARELIAVHNVRADKLLEALRIGGLPSPSIAILRANMADEIDKFGEISLVFSKETVDPKENQNNRIYSSDAYTPTKVNTEYEIAEEKAEKTYEKMRNVLKNAPEEYKSKIVWFTPNNLEDLLNRFGGEKGLEESYANDMGMKQIYLIAHGKNPVAPVYRDVREEVTQADRELYDYLLDAMGDEILTGTLTRNWYQKNGDLLRKNYGQFFKERFGFDEAQVKALDDNMKGVKVVSIARKARQYRENGPVTIRKEEDFAAYKRKIDEAVPQKEYELWIKELFTGIEGRKGIWKGEDPYDSAGNRKPWEELYREYTLQNIVSAMNEQQAQGKSFLVSNIFGGAAERFQSIEQVRERKDRLKKVNETEYNRMRENILSRYDLLCESMTQGDDFFSVSDVVVEAIAQSETQKEFLEYLRRELKGWANYDPNAAKEIWGIIEEIRAMPVGYFEAKPQRAVYFNEVYEAVIPDNADKTLKTALDEAGVHYETYRAGDSTDRAKKLNGMEQIRFSKNSKYNEYETLRMQWANSAATEAGDMAILNRKGREFVLLEATGNDTIELMKGTYKKVSSYYERTYGETIHRIYEHIESIKAEQNRDTGDLLNAGNRRHAVRDAGQDGRKGLQTDTAGNDEHLRGRHQGTSFRKSLNDTRTVNSLVKENEKLREALELAKRELQLTKGHKMNPKQVEALARGILRKTSSRYSQKTLTENLTRIFEYIANDKEANYSVAIDAMADLSKAVLEESYVKNDSLYTQYKDMREYFRKTAIRLSETAKEEIPEYESFRKENLGRLRISEKGIELDALWGEISQQWPEFFPQDTQEAQQVYLIADALDAVQPTYENPYGYDMDEAAYDLALEMYDRYFDVAEIHTFADKKRREIQLLKAEYRQKLQEKHKEDKAAFDKSLKEVKAEYKNRMKSVTAETAKRIQQIQRAEAAKRITMRERHIETERKQMVRRQIISKTKALNNMLVNPTDQKHIPEALKKQILAFCKEMSKTGIFTRERLLDLKDRYNAIEKQASSDYESYMLYGVYDEDAADLIGKLADTIGGKRLSQLDLKELGDVRKVVEQLRFMVENENQLFATEKKETVTQAGESIIADLQKKKQRTEIAGLTKLQDYFALGCAKPVYFFKYIGGPFQELYNRVAQGEADYARTVDDAKQFFEKTAKKYDFYQWCDQKDGFKEQPKREIRFETERGESVALSVEEALSIYATGRRKQGVDHLMEGGYQLSKGNIKTQTGDKGSLIKRYIDNTVIKLTESDLLKVSESLTQQQRDFADEMVRYLSTDMAALGNTVSLRMNGLKKFNESYYFPIKSTRNFLYTTQRTNQVDNRIKHKGMTKRVTPGASNPINIAPFSDVWTDHCVDMAEYYALSLPLEDFNRVYNYKAVTDGGNEITVKEALKNIYGKKAQDYIDKLMEDINGGVTVRNTEGFSDNMIAKFKKSKVVLSFTVTLKQAASLPRAFALIDPKYLLKQNRGQSFDDAWNELKKYAPVAIIKEIGSFDTNLRTRTGDWIKEREYDRVFVKGQSAEQSLQNLATKSKALLLDSTYRDNVLTDMPGKVDQAVWIMLWNASKAEVQEKNPKLSGEELLQKAGQRFTEIIQFTQVYDSVFSRPQFLRSSSQVTKMASSFMAEPLTSLNMLADGIIRRKDGAYLTRVFASYIASAFFEVVVSSIWYAARDDDDDKTFLEKYAVSVITNFLQNLNPLNMIPFLSDVVNIFSGYDVERSDMGLVTDLYDATTGLWDEDKSAGEKLFGVLGTVGNFFGIPLENVVRDTKAFGNLIGEIGNDGGRTTTASGIWNGVLEEYEYGLSGKFITPKSEAEQYVDAMLKGDRETAEKIYQNMESGGKDESKINSAVRAVLKENEQIRKAAEARANGDTETYIQIAKSMISRGFSQDVVVGAINSAMNQLEKEKEAEAESEDVGSIESAANEAEKSEKATSFYSTQDVIKSLESGNTQSAQKAVLDIYNTKVENKVAEGKTKKEADKSARSSIKSALTSEYKARYVNGTASERSKIQKMLKSIYINGKPLYENKDFSSWLKD